MPKKNQILVVSDFHLTAGRNPRSGTWSPTEDFFWDEEFADFLAHYGARGGWTLVVNGDLFDFLQVLERPTPEECRAYGIPAGDRSRRYGLRASEPAAVFQLDRIADGHPAAFRALAGFLASGNRVIILKGNHDVQLFWPAVQDRLRDRLEASVPGKKRAAVRANLEILPWCFAIPGLLYCEHGNQYEAATSYAHFLNPLLPPEKPGANPQIELDLGSLVVRYISNRLEVLDPRSDNYRPFSAYLTLFLRRHPFEFLSTVRAALRYIRKTADMALRTRLRSRSAAVGEIAARNRSMVAAEAERISGADRGDRDRLREALIAVSAGSATPTLSTGVNRFIWEQAKPALRFLAWCAPLYLLTYIPDAAAALRPHVPGTDLLFFLRVPQALLALALIAAALQIRNSLQRRRRSHSALDDPVLQLRAAARTAARKLKVRYVTFGHSHVEEEVRFEDGGAYFNTGSWIGIATEETPLHRGTVQFTYLKIEGEDAGLFRWQKRGAVPRPAVIVDPTPFRSS